MAFEVRPADVEEATTGEPEALARANAILKADAVPGDLVLGVDTVVALDGAVYGKPPDAEAARAMIGRLNGRTHTVFSGIALRRDGRTESAVARTAVTFADTPPEALDRYVATGEWEGRAGGYAIQGKGALLVEAIAGDYLNVVGLPVTALRGLWPEIAG